MTEDFRPYDDSDIDYTRDVNIDKYDLVNEWNRQGKLRAKWHKMYVEAKKEKARAKRDLANVRSTLAAKARKSWDILGFPKMPTDQMVNDWIPLQTDYMEAEEILIEAQRKEDILSGAKDSFDDRRFALRDTVQLFLREYYADEKMIGTEAKDLLQSIESHQQDDQLNLSPQFQKKERPKLKRKG